MRKGRKKKKGSSLIFPIVISLTYVEKGKEMNEKETVGKERKFHR